MSGQEATYVREEFNKKYPTANDFIKAVRKASLETIETGRSNFYDEHARYVEAGETLRSQAMA